MSVLSKVKVKPVLWVSLWDGYQEKFDCLDRYLNLIL